MGRWQPIGRTEGLWREVAAPPPLAFSERSPSSWLRHREDRQWQLPAPKPTPARGYVDASAAFFTTRFACFGRLNQKVHTAKPPSRANDRPEIVSMMRHAQSPTQTGSTSCTESLCPDVSNC